MTAKRRMVTIVQARMGSTRLPGKVLKPLAGSTVLARMLERVLSARLVGVVAVATTTETEDERIVAACEDLGVLCFRGHPTDLLDRHLRAAEAFGADAVVKIPSDCPLIDPAVIDAVLREFMDSAGAYDYVSNLHPATYPDGNDVEVMGIDALETAWREAERPFEREHTTPFLWENPERFRIGNVEWENGFDLSMSHRFTLDYQEDYELVSRVFDALYPGDPRFGVRDIISFLIQYPEIYELNARHRGVNWYWRHLNELRTVSALETRQPGAA
ncbi:MAG TPA: glycosyltransferase family protein [Thermoanaerobaculaceae bacterium]|nr:glycosyltransferase family protein [Thermoanaerobaculaceae bacterium]